MLETEVVNRITEYLIKKNIRHKKEVRMGIGVPDITLNIGGRKNLCLLKDYCLLSICECVKSFGVITVEELRIQTQINDKRLQSCLNELIEKGIIKLNNNKLRLVKKIFSLDLGKVISIEVKLKDWKNGLLQARRYLIFSDYSYLALPEEKIKNVDIDSVQRYGIGLLSVKNDGKIEEIVTPIKSNECDYKQKYIISSHILENLTEEAAKRKKSIFD